MRRLLFLMFILIIGSVFLESIIFAQEQENIKYVIKEYINAVILGDLDTAMKYISKNYSFIDTQGRNVDYQQIRSILENRINQRQKKYVDYSITDLQIEVSSLEDSLAEAKVEYKWKGFNLNTLQEEMGEGNLQLDLKKEGNEWKIIKFNVPSSN